MNKYRIIKRSATLGAIAGLTILVQGCAVFNVPTNREGWQPNYNEKSVYQMKNQMDENLALGLPENSRIVVPGYKK